MESVAIYSDADAGGGHVRAADVAVRIGPAPAAESYLRDRCGRRGGDRDGRRCRPSGLRLPRRAGRLRRRGRGGRPDLHRPGLGHDRPARRQARGASRRRSRSEYRSCRAPSRPPPWTGPTNWPPSSAEADRVGYPLLVKAAAGGGGRGMRRVERPADLPAALAAGAHESAAAFGDGRVYLEREVLPARHIEVQLLGDAAGSGRRGRRAGLLDPAASPEARRGGSGSRAWRRPSVGRSTSTRSGSGRRPVSAMPPRPSSSATPRGGSGSSRSTPASRSSTR